MRRCRAPACAPARLDRGGGDDRRPGDHGEVDPARRHRAAPARRRHSGSVGPGAKAYFDYVNAQGGVNGRKIEYRYYDDGYDPVQTVQLTRKLVEQDKVFAIFNSVGTANNAAIQPYLNQPGCRSSSSATAPASSRPALPVDDGFLQSYVGEGAVYGRHLAATRKGAKIAVLYERTPLGTDMTTASSAGSAARGRPSSRSRATSSRTRTSPRRWRS